MQAVRRLPTRTAPRAPGRARTTAVAAPHRPRSGPSHRQTSRSRAGLRTAPHRRTPRSGPASAPRAPASRVASPRSPSTRTPRTAMGAPAQSLPHTAPRAQPPSGCRRSAPRAVTVLWRYPPQQARADAPLLGDSASTRRAGPPGSCAARRPRRTGSDGGSAGREPGASSWPGPCGATTIRSGATPTARRHPRRSCCSRRSRRPPPSRAAGARRARKCESAGRTPRAGARTRGPRPSLPAGRARAARAPGAGGG